MLSSEGDINLLASHVSRSEQGGRILSGSINAGGSISASGPIEVADLKAGHNINAGSIYAGKYPTLVEVSPQLAELMQWEVRLLQAATSLPLPVCFASFAI